MWDVMYVFVTCLIHMRDTTRFFGSPTPPSRMSPSCVTVMLTRLMHVCGMPYSYAYVASFIHMTWCVSDSYEIWRVWHALLIWHALFIWHALSFDMMCVLIHMTWSALFIWHALCLIPMKYDVCDMPYWFDMTYDRSLVAYPAIEFVLTEPCRIHAWVMSRICMSM